MKHFIYSIPLALSVLSIGCNNDVRVGENIPPGDAAGLGDAPGAAEVPSTPGVVGCCDVGVLARLGKTGQQGSPPVPVWNGQNWTVAWQEFASQKLTLSTIASADGTLLREHLTDIRLRPFSGVWHSMGTALVGSTSPLQPAPDPYRAAFMIIDEEGRLQTSVALPEGTTDAAVRYWRSQNLWTVFAFKTPQGFANAELRYFDSQLNPVEIDSRRNFNRRCAYGDFHSVALVDLGDAQATVCSEASGISTVTFDKSTLEPWPAGRQVPADHDVAYIKAPELSTFAAATMSNRIFVAGTTSGLSLLWNHAGKTESIRGPLKVDSTTIVGYPNSPSIAADELGQTMGLCYLDRDLADPQKQSVKFALLNADGNLIGQPLTVIPNMEVSNACAVSAGPAHTYLVAAWLSSQATVSPMMAVKVTATR